MALVRKLYEFKLPQHAKEPSGGHLDGQESKCSEKTVVSEISQCSHFKTQHKIAGLVYCGKSSIIYELSFTQLYSKLKFKIISALNVVVNGKTNFLI